MLKSDKFVSSDGVKIHYLKTPKTSSDKWLVFLHGAGGDATAWKKVQELCFRNDYASIAIDLRGHGWSDDSIDGGVQAFDRMAQDVDELIKRLGLNQVIIVGHCFGGMTSMVLAASKHRYIRGLILVDSSDKVSVFGLPRSVLSIAARFVRKLAFLFPRGDRQKRPNYEIFIGTKDLDLKRFISDVKHTSIRSYLCCCSDLLSFDASDLLKDITYPTLVLCGQQDIILPPKLSERLARGIKESKLVIIPKTNHIIVISDPDALAKEILTFIKGL